jgi:hypothetical protein
VSLPEHQCRGGPDARGRATTVPFAATERERSFYAIRKAIDQLLGRQHLV